MAAQVDVSVDALVYEAIQRIYRNSIVAYVRERLVAAFPERWPERLQKIMTPEEWQEIVANANLADAAGIIRLAHKDEFEFLGVNHFRSLFESSASCLLSDDGRSPEVARKRRQHVLALLSEIKAIRDPISHPPTEELSLRDAMRVVEFAQHVLEVLGLDGSAQLARIYEVLLDRSAAGRRSKISNSRLNLVPAPLSALLGREKELGESRRLLLDQGTRLLTLTGPGGVGKTRLAIELAGGVRNAFKDGLVYLPLDRIKKHSRVPQLLAEYIGVPISKHERAIDTLSDYLRDKSMLIVLDNFEHVIGARKFARDLLEECRHIKILITSRRALSITGEQQYMVPPLGMPESSDIPLEELSAFPAVALFVQAVRGFRRGFRLSKSNADAIFEICRRLDGLPLAIGLAASRLRVVSVPQLLTDLDHFMGSSSRLDGPKRQQTLEATMQWSYQLLSKGEAELFRRVSAFRAGGKREDIRRVCLAAGPMGISVDDGLEALLNSSLLVLSDDRISMLTTVQDFAFRQLEETSEFFAVMEAFSDHFIQVAADSASETGEGASPHLEHERRNLELAIDFMGYTGDVQLLTRLGDAALSLEGFDIRFEVADQLDDVLTESATLDGAVQARALDVLGRLRSDSDDERAIFHFEESISRWKAIGDNASAADVMDHLTDYYESFLPEQVIPQLRRTLRLRRKTGQVQPTAKAVMRLAVALFDLEAYDREAVGVELGFARSHDLVGKARIRALSSLDQALMKVKRGETVGLKQTIRRVRLLLIEGAELFREARQALELRKSLTRLSSAHLFLGDYASALSSLAGAKLAKIPKEELPWVQGAVLPLAIRLLLRLDDSIQSKHLPTLWYPLVANLARLAASKGEFSKCARLAAFISSRAKPATSLALASQSSELIAAVKSELGEGATHIVTEEGKNMNLLEALVYAHLGDDRSEPQ